MSEVKVGDIVSRKSYGHDLKFKVVEVIKNKSGNRNLVLKGIDFRIEADAPEDDLDVVSEDQVEHSRKQLGKWIEKSINDTKSKRDKEFLRNGVLPFYRATQTFERLGRVLHLDGADDFVERCREHYDNLKINAEVIEVSEAEQPLVVRKLLQEYNPDILILTGHDGMIKNSADYGDLANYRNSVHFVNAVKEARKYEKSLDNLIIFAGACQSNYEAILKAGANFSSSPKRVLIHMFDPVIVAEKVASARIDKILSIDEIVEGTQAGFDGIGGLQTRGMSRLGRPKISYE